ncbi:MAG: transketolase, partial [Planctomycetia bacterium]|nr:transketolase [Planctomycetia bacterium]
MSFKDAIDAKARQIGQLAVRMTTASGSGHPSSALSLAHITTVLMYDVMRYDPDDPWNPLSDRLVLSEGHAVPIVYAAYADLGGAVGKTPQDARPLTVDDLDSLREIDSVLDGHPNPALGFHFFDAATGSLGQGLSIGAGLALAARLDGIDKNIYVICGDGESREGQIAEALDFIADHKLTNVRVIFNANGQGQSDYVSRQQSVEFLEAKLEAAGLRVEVVDGHDGEALKAALTLDDEDGRPVAIIARTVKGWGSAALQEGNWHGKPLPEDKLEEVLAELEPKGKVDVELAPKKPAGKAPEKKCVAAKLPPPDFEKLLTGDKFKAKFDSNGKLSTRRAYGLALRELGRLRDDIVVLDGDVSNSTFSEYFKFAIPERYFEGRIAEQNMISVAAGLAAAGKIPFANSFGKFLSRGFDQVEMAAITCANLKLVGSHSGVTLGPDGPSQMGVVDVAFFRAISSVERYTGGPAAVLLTPADAVASYRLLDAIVAHDGLVYMRTLRSDLPLLYKPDEEFEIGGFKVLAEGADITLVASGYMVHEALAHV